ncbi:MAG TPA: hypothetical protein H9871_09130 [Candidatus Nesterenkonia stercoripullorum]|uniref:DUF308 domain-containing protein n=1 Tax=Candidatus Nesterenkonia stercoripullorum TaxID=2838701 RepID=A0A9D1UTR7_9MICC|nr:hypothetical protein [Candidatus Nesterenkonia stercoripullorum]
MMSRPRDDEPSSLFGRSGKARPISGSGRGPRDYSPSDDPLEEIDDFKPPNPKSPLAGARPATVLGALLAIGGVIAVILVSVVPANTPGWSIPALVAVTIAGVVVLFAQMPKNRGGSGDGAQV